MAIVSHSVSPQNHFDREPSPADFPEYAEWANSVERAPLVDCYPDELPEVPDSDFFEPEPFDREWWSAELAHLQSQRQDCLDLPTTLRTLDERIDHARRNVLIGDVAEFLARSRDDHPECERRGAWGSHAAEGGDTW